MIKLKDNKRRLQDTYLDWVGYISLIFLGIMFPIWITISSIITTKELVLPSFYAPFWQWAWIPGVLNAICYVVYGRTLAVLWIVVLGIAYIMGWIHVAVVLLIIFSWIWRRFDL